MSDHPGEGSELVEVVAGNNDLNFEEEPSIQTLSSGFSVDPYQQIRVRFSHESSLKSGPAELMCHQLKARYGGGMEREEHRRLLGLVEAELARPMDAGHLPIDALRARALQPEDDAGWFALGGNENLSDADWVNATLPHLLDIGVSGDSDRRRAQIRMVEVMHDPNRELRGFLRATRSSGEYIALHALVTEYVQRTQDALRAAGHETLELSRQGKRSELHRTENEARSWTTVPDFTGSNGYSGDTIFHATVPVEHIAAFRYAAEQEVFVSRESLDGSRTRLRLNIRRESGDTIMHRLRNWWDVRSQ